jgi:hypothetical protein
VAVDFPEEDSLVAVDLAVAVDLQEVGNNKINNYYNGSHENFCFIYPINWIHLIG